MTHPSTHAVMADLAERLAAGSSLPEVLSELPSLDRVRPAQYATLLEQVRTDNQAAFERLDGTDQG